MSWGFRSNHDLGSEASIHTKLSSGMVGTMKHRRVLIATALMLIVSCGMAQGWMTYRWTANTAVAEAVSLLERVPAQIGDWTAVDLEMSENEIEVGRIEGYIKREYINRVTEARVHFLLMCGEAGPISLHPPTVCFSGQGYRVVGQESHTSIQGTEGCTFNFHEADFGNSAIDDPTLSRLYWAWSTDGEWETPPNPRVEFAGKPALFKLYVSEQWVPRGIMNDTGVAKSFMGEMLPAVRSALHGQNSQGEI